MQLTTPEEGGTFIWMDKETILFSSKRQEKEHRPGENFTSFYTITIHGGEAKKAFTIPLSVQKIKSIGRGKFILSATFDGNQPDLESLDETERERALTRYQEEQDYMVMDELPFWRNGEGFTNSKRCRLFLYEQEGGKLKPLTAPRYQVNSWELNEDKTKLAIVGSKFEAVETLKPQLILMDIPDGQPTVLVEEGNFDFHQLGFVGENLLFAASKQEKFGLNENPCFYTMDLRTWEINQICDPDYSVGNSVGSDCRYGGGSSFITNKDGAAFTITDRSCSRICRLNLAGEPSFAGKLTAKTDTLPEGSVDCFDIKDDLCLFIGMKEGNLQELYAINQKTGEETRLTDFNEDVLRGKEISSPKAMRFVNKEGMEIDGWVLEPVGFDSTQTYPAILDIHGGPKTAYGTIFFHEMQTWAAQGYFVLYCNPRGSDGRGNSFADIRGHYGKEDYSDIMEFVDEVLKVYPQISEDKMGVTGGSYGGFMTNWIIGHTERFAAAASQRSISNWVSMAGTTDIGPFFSADQCGGDAWNNLEAVWEQSPLKYANKCVTPTLFIHSNEDYRCWQAEALQMFSALKLIGVETRICMFKGENHELSRSGKPKHRTRRLSEITSWFNNYLK